MNEKRFYLGNDEWVKFDYSEIREYIDEYPAPNLLRNDEVCDLLNEQQATIRRLQDLCGKSDGENAKLRIENKRLQAENERLKNKLNATALELVDEAISMGKAVEISEMSYREFIDYRAEKGKPMELQL